MQKFNPVVSWSNHENFTSQDIYSKKPNTRNELSKHEIIVNRGQLQQNPHTALT